MTEGERQPRNEITRRQFLQAAEVGALAKACGWLDGMYTALTSPYDNSKNMNLSVGMRLMGDTSLYIAGGKLEEKGEHGLKRLDSGDDDPPHINQHRNENPQELNGTHQPESVERRTITIYPPSDKPTDPEEIVRKMLFELRTNRAAQAKVNKVLLEGAGDVIPELKAYLENGGRVSVTREWRPRLGRPRSRISLTKEGLLLGSVGKGREEVPLTDERINLQAGENGAIKALGRLSAQKVINRVIHRIDPEAVKKIGSSESPPPPSQK